MNYSLQVEEKYGYYVKLVLAIGFFLYLQIRFNVVLSFFFFLSTRSERQ